MAILEIFELYPHRFTNGQYLGAKVKSIKYSMESFVKGVHINSKLVKFEEHITKDMPFDDVINLLESHKEMKTATWSILDEQKMEALEKAPLQNSASNGTVRGEEFECKHLRKLNKIFEFRPAYSSGGKDVG